MGTLFDMIESDGPINVQDRDNMGTGHGWAGANQVFWNCAGAVSICQNPWTSAKNYNFGFQGVKSRGARSGRPDGVWVGHNMPGLFPGSLYDAQLDERVNGTTLFSVISELVQINDSAFLISFTLPVDALTVHGDQFEISGTAGAENTEFSVELMDPYTVIITFTGLNTLPPFSTLIVHAKELTSLDGKELLGVTNARFTAPEYTFAGRGEEPDPIANSCKITLWHNQLVVEPDSDALYSLEIFTLSGQLVFQHHRLRGMILIPIDRSSHLLLIQYCTGGDIATQKIILP